MQPQPIRIRRRIGARSRTLVGLFDTGAEEGLIRESTASGLIRNRLPDPIRASGIGGGSVILRETAVFQIQTLGKWCRYSALIAPDRALDVDLLIGEDFLFRYGLRLDPRRNRVDVANREQFRRMTREKLFIASPRRRGRR